MQINFSDHFTHLQNKKWFNPHISSLSLIIQALRYLCFLPEKKQLKTSLKIKDLENNNDFHYWKEFLGSEQWYKYIDNKGNLKYSNTYILFILFINFPLLASFLYCVKNWNRQTTKRETEKVCLFVCVCACAQCMFFSKGLHSVPNMIKSLGH